MYKIIALIIYLIPIYGMSQLSYEWGRSFGGSDREITDNVIQTINGELILIGSFSGTSDFNPDSMQSNMKTSNGELDAFIAKFDSLGNLKWVRTWGGTGDDGLFSAISDSVGNIYVSGIFEGSVDFDPGGGTVIRNSKGDRDGFISKFDANGQHIWTITFGSGLVDYVTEVEMDRDGNLICIGFFNDSIDVDPSPSQKQMIHSNGKEDIYVAKLDPNGKLIWYKTIGGIGSDQPLDLLIGESNELFISGGFQNTVDFDPASTFNYLYAIGGFDAFVLKLDSSGEFSRVLQFGGSLWEFPNYMHLSDSGYLYVIGSFEGSVDFDPGPGVVIKTSNGSYDIFCTKLNSYGHHIKTISFGGPLGDNAYVIDKLKNNHIILTGNTNGEVDFDPSSGSLILKSDKGAAFLSGFNSSLEHLWAAQIKGTSSSMGTAISQDQTTNLYWVGSYADTADLDISVNEDIHISKGFGDNFLIKFSLSDDWLNSSMIFNKPNNPNVFPNPSHGSIRLSGINQGAIIEVFSYSGEKVYSETLPESKNSFTLPAGLNDGIYILKCTSKDFHYSQKIILRK